MQKCVEFSQTETTTARSELDIEADVCGIGGLHMKCAQAKLN